MGGGRKIAKWTYQYAVSARLLLLPMAEEGR